MLEAIGREVVRSEEASFAARREALRETEPPGGQAPAGGQGGPRAGSGAGRGPRGRAAPGARGDTRRRAGAGRDARHPAPAAAAAATPNDLKSLLIPLMI